MSGKISLFLGGARCGKSRRAQEMAAGHSSNVVYIATCATPGLDAEMEERIAIHKSHRPAHWDLVENRFDLANVVREKKGPAFLLDCLTLWLAYRQGEGKCETDILAELDGAFQCVREQGAALFIVSNEIGMGLVPELPGSREFRDLCGRANQFVAGKADQVEFMLAGLPLKLK